jgi:hypothetical protein
MTCQIVGTTQDCKSLVLRKVHILCAHTHILVDVVRNLVFLINVTIFQPSLITQSHAFLELNIHITHNHEFLVVMYIGFLNGQTK